MHLQDIMSLGFLSLLTATPVSLRATSMMTARSTKIFCTLRRLGSTMSSWYKARKCNLP